MMRFSSVSMVSLFAVMASSGCAGTSWTAAASSRPVAAIAVAPAELHGAANPKVVARERLAFIKALRARGYAIIEDNGDTQPGMVRVTLRFDGTGISDAQMHAPDDARHGIVNDLSYYFVAYKVRLDVTDGDGHALASGTGHADQDPAAVMKTLTERLANDVPPSRGDTFAQR